MNLTLLYFDDCPNWTLAAERLAELSAEYPSLSVSPRRVDTIEEAHRVGFNGSPSVQLDGVDLFAEPAASVGLSCRVYRTPDGLARAPTTEQLRAALLDAQRRTG